MFFSRSAGDFPKKKEKSLDFFLLAYLRSRLAAQTTLMKKQVAPSSKAHLIRNAFYLLLLLTVCVIPFALAQRTVSKRTLTFADRVAYQRAIEDVYWRHRIWPKERPDSKPSLDAVISQAQLEKKVKSYLRNSEALEDDWQRPITAEQLQAEMDRMAQNTRQPEVLQELFEALGNDPSLIAECLARPLLAERLLAHPAIERVKQQSRTFDR